MGSKETAVAGFTSAQRRLITGAAVAFLVLAVVGLGTWGLGAWHDHQSQQRRQDLRAKRAPICTEIFTEAKDAIETHSVAASQRFFTLTRSTAADLAQSDPLFSQAIQRMTLTVEGTHALDAYC